MILLNLKQLWLLLVFCISFLFSVSLISKLVYYFISIVALAFICFFLRFLKEDDQALLLF